MLLDFSADKRPGDIVTTADVRGALDRLDYRLKDGDAVLLRSGADAHFEDDPAFGDQGVALEREALTWLLDQGVRVMGTDAESLDGPLTPMVEALRAGNADGFYPVQYAAREREFCVIPKMDLRGLPRAHGFKVVAFPIKLEGASAAWTRAVALVP